jgi:hypothetical protein
MLEVQLSSVKKGVLCHIGSSGLNQLATFSGEI